MRIPRISCDTSSIFETFYYIQDPSIAMWTFPEASQWCIWSKVITDDLRSKRSTFYRDKARFIFEWLDGSNDEVDFIVE